MHHQVGIFNGVTRLYERPSHIRQGNKWAIVLNGKQGHSGILTRMIHLSCEIRPNQVSTTARNHMLSTHFGFTQRRSPFSLSLNAGAVSTV
jgi:hypothetical protein